VEGLRLRVISLRYSSWSMRPWLALTHAGASFLTETVELPLAKQDLTAQADTTEEQDAMRELSARRAMGSITGKFPVLHVRDTPIHESLAICEWANDTYPAARLLPESALDRARARAISSEMATGFTQLRTHLSCHLFGRVPGFVRALDTLPAARALEQAARDAPAIAAYDDYVRSLGGDPVAAL
jgi:glutathione S-transferase